MPERTLCLTDAEAALAAQGKLGAIVRRAADPIVSYSDGCKRRVFKLPDAAEEINALISGRIPGRFSNPKLMPITPFPAPGQRLGLKETWGARPYFCGGIQPSTFCYKTDGYHGDHPENWTWRSPVTMPAEFIRRHPIVAEVRAVQVKNISEGDMELVMADDIHYMPVCRPEPAKYDSNGVCYEPAWCGCSDYTLNELWSMKYNQYRGSEPKIDVEAWVWFARLDWERGD